MPLVCARKRGGSACAVPCAIVPCNAARALLGIAAVGVHVVTMCLFVLVVAFMHRFVSHECGHAVACGRAIKGVVV